MRPVVLATRNPGKASEIRSLLAGVPLEIKSLSEFPPIPEVAEDGETLEANAIKKAAETSAGLKLPAIADDSGLEVYALEMMPGVRSARYAGEHVTYEDNNRRLLRELYEVPEKERGARFRCVAAFAAGGIVRTVEGICTGRIGFHERGDGGFGYDPLFIPDGYDETFAELPAAMKNVISHRARAFGGLKEILREYVDNFS